MKECVCLGQTMGMHTRSIFSIDIAYAYAYVYALKFIKEYYISTLYCHQSRPSWTPCGRSRSVWQGPTGALKVFQRQIRCHSMSSPTDDCIGLCGRTRRFWNPCPVETAHDGHCIMAFDNRVVCPAWVHWMHQEKHAAFVNANERELRTQFQQRPLIHWSPCHLWWLLHSLHSLPPWPFPISHSSLGFWGPFQICFSKRSSRSAAQPLSRSNSGAPWLPFTQPQKAVAGIWQRIWPTWCSSNLCLGEWFKLEDKPRKKR